MQFLHVLYLEVMVWKRQQTRLITTSATSSEAYQRVALNAAVLSSNISQIINLNPGRHVDAGAQNNSD